MCIIAYVRAGKDVSDERIRYMFRGNPDGAGLMWKPTPNSEVEIRKGFMNVEDLIRAYRAIPKSCERAMHMRIATAGKVSVDCCHPFPVRKSVDLMRNHSDRTDVALMHNGVLSYCQPKGGMASTYSDTMLFAVRYLYHFKNILDDLQLQTLLEEANSSRLLIMRKGKPTIMIGDWKTEDGVLYSNGNYKPVTYTYSKSNPYYYYNYGCEYDGYTYTQYGSTKTASKSTIVAPVEKKCDDKANDNELPYETVFEIDVSDFVNESVKNGLDTTVIEDDIIDYVCYDIAQQAGCGDVAPEYLDATWAEPWKTMYIWVTGVPETIETLGGFKAVHRC